MAFKLGIVGLNVKTWTPIDFGRPSTNRSRSQDISAYNSQIIWPIIFKIGTLEEVRKF